MAQMKMKGLALGVRLKKDNLSVYTRCGRIVVRPANSEMPKSRTRGQLTARQRVAHSANLWKALREGGNALFAGATTAYGRFCSLMRKMPPVYLTKQEYRNYGALLLPGMPVSDGILPDIGYDWGETEGTPALVTSIALETRLPYSATGTDMVRALCSRKGLWKEGDRLRLYTLVQRIESMIPKVYVTMEELTLECGRGEWRFAEVAVGTVGGRLALVGDTLADSNKGWALTHIRGEKSSSQRVISRCTLYERYTTEEALQRAAKSYGGLTEKPYITP